MPDTIPQSEHGGIHPELAARITAAKAVLGDFAREADAYGNDSGGPTPDWFAWAFRLHAENKRLIEMLERLS